MHKHIDTHRASVFLTANNKTLTQEEIKIHKVGNSLMFTKVGKCH